MNRNADRKLTALVRLAGDRGATAAERVLAAQRAAEYCGRTGRDYLEFFPLGLPELGPGAE